MNRLIIYIYILLCIAFTACKKAPGPADGNSVQLNNNQDSTVSLSATINGAKWQTDSALGYIEKTAGNDSTVENLLITAVKITGNPATTLVFNITRYTGPQTYTIGPPLNTATYYVGTQRHYALSGQVIVTVDSAYALKGTFNFVTDSFVVANGVFNVASP